MTSGVSKLFARTSNAGLSVRCHFCPDCGTTLHWTLELRPGLVGIAAGAFVDNDIPAPNFAVFARNRRPWTHLPDGPSFEAMP